MRGKTAAVVLFALLGVSSMEALTIGRPQLNQRGLATRNNLIQKDSDAKSSGGALTSANNGKTTDSKSGGSTT